MNCVKRRTTLGRNTNITCSLMFKSPRDPTNGRPAPRLVLNELRNGLKLESDQTIYLKFIRAGLACSRGCKNKNMLLILPPGNSQNSRPVKGKVPARQAFLSSGKPLPTGQCPWRKEKQERLLKGAKENRKTERQVTPEPSILQLDFV